jgi:hypothetical protein
VPQKEISDGDFSGEKQDGIGSGWLLEEWGRNEQVRSFTHKLCHRQ